MMQFKSCPGFSLADESITYRTNIIFDFFRKCLVVFSEMFYFLVLTVN